MRLLSSIIDLVTTGKERKKYEELKNNPEKSAHSTRYGKKFIHCGIEAIVMAVIALVFSVLARLCYSAMSEVTLAVGFEAIGFIVCIACAALMILYSVLFLLSRLKYIRWQKSLNDLPIYKSARIFSIAAFLVVVALCITSVIVFLTAL